MISVVERISLKWKQAEKSKKETAKFRKLVSQRGDLLLIAVMIPNSVSDALNIRGC